MCKGPDPPEFSDPSPSPSSWRRRAAEMEAELALARTRLMASVEALRRERERADELLRRLEESLSERERLRKMVAAMDVVRQYLITSRLRTIAELVRSAAPGAGASDEGPINEEIKK